MALNPGIALGVKPPQFYGPGDLISLRSAIQQQQLQGMALAMESQKLNQQIALRDIMSNPDNYDPSGNLSSNGLKNLWQVDPGMAMKMQQNNLNNLFKRAQIENQVSQEKLHSSENFQQKEKLMDSADQDALSAYQGAIDKGIKPDIASQRAAEAGNERLKELRASGLFADQELPPTYTFDYTKAMARSMSYKDRIAERDRQSAAQEKLRHDLVTEKQGAQKIAQNDISTTVDPGQVEEVIQGLPRSYFVTGFSPRANQQWSNLQTAAIDKIIKDNPGTDRYQAGKMLSDATIMYKAKNSSVGQLNKMLGATRQAVSQLEYNANQAAQAMQQVPGSDASPVLNAIARGAQKWTGDPRYTKLFFYMQATMLESARILAGGQASVAQLSEGARNEAQRLININMTPQSFLQGYLPSVLKEGQYRVDTYQGAIDAQLGRQTPSSQAPAPAPSGDHGKIVRTGTYNGRKVIQYEDGTIDYAQ